MNIAVPARVQGYCGVEKRVKSPARVTLAPTFAQANPQDKAPGFWSSRWHQAAAGLTGLLALVGVGCTPVGGYSVDSPPTSTPTTQTVFHADGVEIPASGGTQTRIGNITIESEGRTFTHIGNFAIGSDGTTQTRICNMTLGSDGRTFTHIGNFAIGSDGTTQTRIGNMTLGSDGSTTFHFGN